MGKLTRADVDKAAAILNDACKKMDELTPGLHFCEFDAYRETFVFTRRTQQAKQSITIYPDAALQLTFEHLMLALAQGLDG